MWEDQLYPNQVHNTPATGQWTKRWSIISSAGPRRKQLLANWLSLLFNWSKVRTLDQDASHTKNLTLVGTQVVPKKKKIGKDRPNNLHALKLSSLKLQETSNSFSMLYRELHALKISNKEYSLSHSILDWHALPKKLLMFTIPRSSLGQSWDWTFKLVLPSFAKSIRTICAVCSWHKWLFLETCSSSQLIFQILW